MNFALFVKFFYSFNCKLLCYFKKYINKYYVNLL